TGSSSGVGFAGAGSGSGNSVGNETKASISGGSVPAATDLTVKARDQTGITADAGGVAIVFARGPPFALAIGISVAVNGVTNTVHATVSLGAVVVAPNVGISSTSSTHISALTIAGSGTVSTSGSSGFVAAGAGAVSINSIGNTLDAKIDGSAVAPVSVSTGALSVTATDDSHITADAGGVAAAIAAGGSATAGVAAAASVAINSVGDTVNAVIDGSSVGTALGRVASVDVEASFTGVIKTLAVVGAVSVASSEGLGVAATLAGAVTSNTTGNAPPAHLPRG